MREEAKRGQGEMERLAATEMARLMGWYVMRRTNEACDGCEGAASNERPIWLVSRQSVRSNDVTCLCEPCLDGKLQAHVREQAGMDALVEATGEDLEKGRLGDLERRPA